jgi:hypothetical protein
MRTISFGTITHFTMDCLPNVRNSTNLDKSLSPMQRLISLQRNIHVTDIPSCLWQEALVPGNLYSIDSNRACAQTCSEHLALQWLSKVDQCNFSTRKHWNGKSERRPTARTLPIALVLPCVCPPLWAMSNANYRRLRWRLSLCKRRQMNYGWVLANKPKFERPFAIDST